MRSHKFKSIVMAATVAILVSGCGDPFFNWPYPFNQDLPGEVLSIPNPDEDVSDEYFSTLASDLNETGRVVGFTNDSSGPSVTGVDDFLLMPVRGFAVDVDGANYVSLVAPDALATWPMGINDAGLVVGAQLTDSGGSYRLRAFSVHDDGTGFTDLHPTGSELSVATHVNGDGVVFGHTVNAEVREAVIFATDGSAPTTLAPSGHVDSLVEAVTTTWAVVSAALPDSMGERLLFLYTVDGGAVEELVIPGVPSDLTDVEEINEAGTMVGWNTDISSAQEFGDSAFTFTIGDASARILDDVFQVDDWSYVEHRFLDFASDGTIVGIAYRVGPNPGLPQARAARYSWDFSEFEDITPPNKEAYSEAFAINDAGWVIGYAGFAYGDFLRRFSGIRNRAFALLLP